MSAVAETSSAPAVEAILDDVNPGPRATTAALVVIGALTLFLYETIAVRQTALYVLGIAMGLVLYHAAFGFTAAWRNLLLNGRGEGLRAQMLMLTIASMLIMPAVAKGSLFGHPVWGAVAPVGVSVLVGAFLFGIGMQLGGACGSGTLFTAGAGNARMAIVLAFFIVGSLIGTLHLPWWLAQPSLGSISLTHRLGLGPALAVQLIAFGGIAAFSARIEMRRHGWLDHGVVAHRHGWRRLLQGPWPLVWGAVLLALFNWATVAIAGHTWSVTFAFSLWGAKIASASGVEVASWPYWTWPFPAQALKKSVFADPTSVMNFGIICGAFLAAGLARRFAPPRTIGLRSLLAAVIGGLLLGYGARLGFGCNIGAYFSGIASGSVHGWLWFASALAGNFLGARLRPFMGMEARRR